MGAVQTQASPTLLDAAISQYNPGCSTYNAAEFSSTIRAVASSMPPGART